MGVYSAYAVYLEALLCHDDESVREAAVLLKAEFRRLLLVEQKARALLTILSQATQEMEEYL